MRKHVDELAMLIVALLFGFAYSIQSMGAQYVLPFSFSVIKNLLGFVSLFIVSLFIKGGKNPKKEIIYGFIIAVLLTIFTYLQQIVALDNTPGKTGFITSMYIVEVPIVNFLVFKKKINLQTILSLLFAVAGLVFLCDLTNFSIRKNDILTIVCSLLLCCQIIILERRCSDINPIRLNMFMSLFIIVLSTAGALITKEPIDFEGYKKAIIPLIYVGIGCAAIGCTLQVFAQKTLDSTTASLILSLESLFSVFAGYLLMDATLSKKEIIGCLLMFIAVVMCVTADREKKTQ